MSGTFLGDSLGGGFFPAAAAAGPVTPPAPTSEAVASGGSVTGWTFSAFTDPDGRIASYSATLTTVYGSGTLSGSGLGPYSITGTADGDAYTVELDALDGDGAVLATATHSVAIAAAGYVTGSFVQNGRIQLDGVNDRVNFGRVTALEMTASSTWSVSAWVNTVGAVESILGIGSATNANDEFFFYTQSNLFGVYLKLNGTLYQAVASWNRLLGLQHLMLTCDGSSVTPYLNGAAVSWSSVYFATWPTSQTWDATTEVFVGHTPYSNYYYVGSLEQVAMWSTDQSANVAAIYALNHTGDMRTLGTPPDLLYAPFKIYGDSETAASGISDLSGNNYDGTGQNMTGTELAAYIYFGDSA